MSVKINENPEHGISLDYIKAVKAVNNQNAARKGGISLEYISNVTNGIKNATSNPAAEPAKQAAAHVASAPLMNARSQGESTIKSDRLSMGRNVPVIKSDTATDNASEYEPTSLQHSGLESEAVNKTITKNIPTKLPDEHQRNVTKALRTASETDAIDKRAKNTVSIPQSAVELAVKGATAHLRTRGTHVTDATSEAVKTSIENGMFDVNQSVDWATDTKGNAISSALGEAINKEKEWQSRVIKEYKNLNNDLSVYGYQINKLGKTPEEAYDQMVYTCYPDGNAPYKSAQDFIDIVTSLTQSKISVNDMEKAREARLSVEKIEKANFDAYNLEQSAYGRQNFSNIAQRSLNSCTEEIWEPSNNNNFKKSAAAFMRGSGSSYADEAYKEDVQDFEDSLKNPIAYIEEYRGQIQDESGINAWTDGASLRNAGIATPEYMYFTESEKLVYSYYAETEGRKKADEYMQSIMHKLTERRNKFKSENNGMENISDWAEENDFLAGAASIPTNLVGGIASTLGMMSGENDKQSGMHYLSNVTNALRQGATRDDSKVGAFFANTAMSIGDNLLASAFGPYAAPAIMGSSATGNAYNSAIQSGTPQDEAATYAIATGLIEWGTEKIPFDRLINLSESGVVFSKENMKQAVKAILGQAATEAGEETVNSYASTLMDIMVRGDNSDYKQYIQAMVAEGMSYEEAEREANINFFLLQPLESAAAGSVSGGVLSTGYTAVNTFTANGNSAGNSEMTLADKVNSGERLTIGEKRKLLSSKENLSLRKNFEQETGISLTGDYSTVSARLDTQSDVNAKNIAEQNTRATHSVNAPADNIGAQTATPERSAEIDARLAVLRREVDTSAQSGIINNYANALENARDVQERRYGSETVHNAARSANILTENKNTLLNSKASSMGQGGVALPVRDGENIITIARSDIAERRNGIAGGISQNISAQLDAVELISAATGVPVYLYDGDATPVKGHDGETVNGFTHRNPETGKAEYIALDINSDAPLLYLLGHEVFHAMGKDSEQKLTEYLSEYADEKLTVEEAANKLGEYLCEPAFCEYLVNRNRPLAQRILNFIKNLIAKLKGQEVEQLNTAQKTLAKALDEYMKNSDISKQGAGGSNEYMTVADSFARDIETWDRDGRKTGGYIRVGTTSEVLQGVGMKAQELYFDKSKIKRILNTHEHMNINLIKQVPQMLEDPIAVLESTAHPNRVVAVGELYDTEGKPIIAAVEMNLKGTNKSEISKIISAYGKRNLGTTFENDRLLYLNPDIKRTTTWFRLLRLQLPAEGINRSGYIAMITPAERDVNGNFSIGNDTKFGTVMQGALKRAGVTNEDDNNSFMYAGRRAETTNASTLNAARQMLLDGVNSETVRQRTGWFKGMDDKWRFEIDDSKLQFNPSGFYEDPETLGDYIRHDALFDAYPELADMPLKFEKLGERHNGRYDISNGEIIINIKLLGDIPKLKRTLVHEIQHAVQQIEDFARGSSRAEWEGNGADSTKETAKSLYRRTAGEIEARDTASRIDYNPDMRKSNRPDIDRQDVVFADNIRTTPKGRTDIGDGVQAKFIDDAKRANRNKKFAAERDLINRIARRTRTKVQYVSSLTQDGKQLTGGCYYHRSSGTMYLNVNSKKALTGAFYRGLLYHISENDTRFVQTTYNYLREYGKDAGWSGNVISQINEVLLKRTDTTRPINAFEEVLADKVAEMFEDENFMRYVSRKNMTFLQKLWENIKNFIIRSLGGTYTPPSDVINAKTAEEIIGKMSSIQVLVADALDRVSHDRTKAAAQAARSLNKEAKSLSEKYVEYNGEAYSENEWQNYETDKIEYKNITVEDLRASLSKMPDAILRTLAREMKYDFGSETSAGRKIEFAKNVLDTLEPDEVLSVPTMAYREGDVFPLTSKEQKENISALKKTGGSIKTIRRYGYQNIADGVTIYVTDPSKAPLSNAHRDNITSAKNLAAALGFKTIGYYTGEIRSVGGKEIKAESRALIAEDGTLYLNLSADTPYTSVVGAAWFENLRRTNTMTAVALVKAYERYRKLIRSKTDISRWIGEQMTSTRGTKLFTGDTLFTQELSRFMNMNAAEILSTIETDSQFSSLISRGDMTLSEKVMESIKGFFTKFGDTIARVIGKADSRAASALTIAQKNLLLAMRDAPIESARAIRNEAQRAAEYRRIQKIEEEIERIERLEAERERAAQRERAERRREYYEELDRQEAENSFMSRKSDDKFADFAKPITADDIQVLREIGRKSINDFTAEDTEKSQKWAYKFWKQLGTKSPFFRSWFGDWRSYDYSPAEPCNIVAKEVNRSNRKVYCKDIGVDIQITTDIFGDSIHYASQNGDKKQVSAMLGNIDEIIEKAVLLGTSVVGDRKSNKKGTSTFMHSLYTVVEFNGAPFMAKISVEEYDVDGKQRAYNLQRIKMSDLSRAQYSELKSVYRGKMRLQSDAISVADLFELVKKYDSKFTPREANPALINEDGTPKVFYHGTPNAVFTVFRGWQYFTEDKSYADVYQHQGTSSNGYKNTAAKPDTYAVYLRANRIFDTRNKAEREIFENEFYMKWGNGAPLSEKGLPDWTDGDDLIEFFDEKGYDYDAMLLDEGGTGGYGDEVKSRGISVVIRDSNQIKSATDNIGTFSENENDIRFMSRSSNISRKVPAAEVIEAIERFEYDEDTLRSIASQIFFDGTDMTAEELYDNLPDVIDTLLEENPSLAFDIGTKTERTGTSLGKGLDELFEDNAEAVEKAVSRFEHHSEIDEESQTLEREPAPIINEEPEVRSKYQELRDRFGTIPQGEDVNSRGDVGVPRRTQKNNKIRQGVRTFAEAKVTPDEVVGELEREILNGTFSYTPLSDKAANNYARSMIESNPEEALKEWDAVVRSTKPATKKQIALAENLIMEAAALGDTDTAVRLIAEVAAEGTRAGQMVQAFRMIKKLSPMGQLYSLQKAIDKLNRENENRGVKIELPNTELEDYAKTVTDLEDLQRRIAELEKQLPESNEKGRLRDELDKLHSEAEQKKKTAEQKLDRIKDNVAEQMPKKWTDKFNAWRYLAMLGNPRTHIRNILGNAVFAPTVTLKSKLAAVMEAGIKKINPNFQRSQSVTASKAIKEFAAKDALEYLQQLGEGGKYNASDAIRDRQKVFSERNIVGRTINKAAAFNSAILEAEDGMFLRKRYAYALAHYCAANRWNIKFLEANPQSLQKAREFAFHEAQRATYRDMNAFSQFLSQASNKLRDGKGFSRVAYWAMEGALPFKKTPANIIKRGVEYSPLGLLNTIMVDSIRLKRGDITGAEYINNLATGMTGTMVLGLGYLLASLGVLRGRSKDDEDEFEELRGAQEWSVIIGDVSYTVDWLAPMSLPLFVGVELYDQTANTNNEMDMQDLLDSLTAIAEPIFSLSMMDGVSRILQSYSSEGAISDMFIAALQSYAGQLTPTVFGQLARTLDDTSRNAYYNDKTSWWSNTIMQPLRSTASKIPGLEEKLPARVDAWGRTTEGTTTMGERFVQNFISPGYWSMDKTTPVDEEIEKIYKETGDASVLPNTAPKQFNCNGETYYLSSEEYVGFAIDRGQTAYTIIEELINSKTYKTLTASERADAVNKAYDIALDYAKGNTESGFDAESNKAIKAFNESGVEYSDYILFSVLCAGASQADAYKALNKMRYLTDAERSALWNTKGWKKSYKEYKAEH